MVIGYSRISTGHQTLENQRKEIEKFAASRSITVDRWVNEIVSGSKLGKDRKLGTVIRKMKKGDTIIVTELSRLSRTLMDIMTIVGDLLKRGIRLYSIKEGCTFDDSINSKVLVFAFGLVAEIERNLISMRTKEALELRRSKGVRLGRPEGSRTKINLLVENSREIQGMLERGISSKEICSQFNVSYSTFRRFIGACKTGVQ